MGKEIESNKAFINLLAFAKNCELWEERKKIICDELSKDLKRKEFIEKHLGENFKNLIPNKTLLDSLKRLIPYKLSNGFQSPDFGFQIEFLFTKRDIFEEKDFKIEIKLKDIATNCKVVNKKELKEIFIQLLYRIGYEIGYVQGMIDRIELDILILRNKGEFLFVNESIVNDLPEKTQYETSLQRVKMDTKKNKELHKFEKYIKDRYGLKNDTEYINHIRKILGYKNISYQSLEKSLGRYRKAK